MVVAEVHDPVSATVVAQFLRAAGLHAWILGDRWLAVPRFLIDVPESEFRRARWYLEVAEVSDTELVYLATGHFSGPVTIERYPAPPRARVGLSRGLRGFAAGVALASLAAVLLSALEWFWASALVAGLLAWGVVAIAGGSRRAA